jgi:hypothetical protein
MGFRCRQPAAAAEKGAQHQGKPPVKNGQHDGKQAQHNGKQPQQTANSRNTQTANSRSTASSRQRRRAQRETAAAKSVTLRPGFRVRPFFILRQPSLTNSCRSLRCPKKPALRLA